MILMVCVDDKNGTMFNRRRQSKDRLLRERILELTEGGRLWMNAYSAKQFGPELPAQIVVDEEYCTKAAPGDFCFMEGGSAAACGEGLEKLILFKWNRTYPADQWFDIRLDEEGWRRDSQEEFLGTSHEKITMEVYVK